MVKSGDTSYAAFEGHPRYQNIQNGGRRRVGNRGYFDDSGNEVFRRKERRTYQRTGKKPLTVGNRMS